MYIRKFTSLKPTHTPSSFISSRREILRFCCAPAYINYSGREYAPDKADYAPWGEGEGPTGEGQGPIES